MPYFASPHTSQIDPFVAALLQAAAAAQHQQQAQHAPAPSPSSRSQGDSKATQSGSKKPSQAQPQQPQSTVSKKPQNRSLRAFSPNFDVYETGASYHLEGELPGVSDKSAIDIEFSDDRTLLIRGRVARGSGLNSKGETKEEAQKRRSLNPTVEDTDDEDDLEHGYSVVKHDDKKQKVENSETVEERKIWLSERTFGPFQRTFSFPTPVDLEKTTASLEAGVLRIDVPKHVFQGTRKIQVM